MLETPHISVVTSLYGSEAYLDTFVEEIRSSMEAIRCENYEIVMVNDGSPDQSLSKAKELQAKYHQIVIVNLSRNFGHHAALKAGIETARGEWIYLSDCDLEISPKHLPEFYARIKADSQIDMVFGVQDKRNGSWFNRFTGFLFYRILNLVSDLAIPENILTERLFNTKIKNALLQMGDHHLFLGGMFHWVGFKSESLTLRKGMRKGKSTYSTAKRLQLMINAISSFSGRPLLWLFYLGLGLSVISFIAAIIIVVMKLRLGDAIQIGWSSLIVLGILCLGLLSTFLGIIGIYLHKMFEQVQNRPEYIIDKVLRR